MQLDSNNIYLLLQLVDWRMNKQTPWEDIAAYIVYRKMKKEIPQIRWSVYVPARLYNLVTHKTTILMFTNITSSKWIILTNLPKIKLRIKLIQHKRTYVALIDYQKYKKPTWNSCLTPKVNRRYITVNCTHMLHAQ